ncbi:MAG TPA: hypothetical protein VE978_07435 [Chitinophagales bacterium]|nr:hypothetical protein [Chitinophagales bacterium]
MDSKNHITYRKLKSEMVSHGFSVKKIQGSHIVFEHKPSKTVMLLPSYRSNSIVSEAHLLGIKRQVVTRGLIPEKEFQKLFSPGDSNPKVLAVSEPPSQDNILHGKVNK